MKPGKINEMQGNQTKDVLLENFTPIPIFDCIVWKLVLLCCEDSADIGCVDIIATFTMFLLPIPDNQWLVSK